MGELMTASTLRRRARRACPLAHRRGSRLCISCVSIEGEMLRSLQRIWQAARRIHTDLLPSELAEILRAEGLVIRVRAGR